MSEFWSKVAARLIAHFICLFSVLIIGGIVYVANWAIEKLNKAIGDEDE